MTPLDGQQNLNGYPSIVPNRSLSDTERGTLALLLSEPFAGSEALMRQIPYVRVTARASEDPSVLLSVGPDCVNRAVTTSSVPVEAEVYQADGSTVYILLHVWQGQLSHLEFFRGDLEPIPNIPQFTNYRILHKNYYTVP